VLGQLRGSPTAVTLVHAEACHFCNDAEQALALLAERFALEVSMVEVDSAEGRRLVDVHRPAMNPLVLVDGAYFSAGRLPRKKLTRLLEARNSAPAMTAPVTDAAPAGR
jgi:alkyl hydroperoxide reductase subunit AhpF